MCRDAISGAFGMTEKEWLESQAPLPMLVFLRGNSGIVPASPCLRHVGLELYSGRGARISPRKTLLFGTACCDLLGDMPLDELSRGSLVAYQKYAYALPPKTWRDCSLRGWRDECRERVREIVHHIVNGGQCTLGRLVGGMGGDELIHAAHVALEVGRFIADDRAKESAAGFYANANAAERAEWGHYGGPPDPAWHTARGAVERDQSELLREIVENPFRSVTLDSTWLSGEARIARQLAQAAYREGTFEALPVIADALEDAGCTEAAILDHCRGPNRHVRGCWVIDLLLGKT